ncbi:unnamed protein product, partial [Ectocarpus sp. 12 AP-2014]
RTEEKILRLLQINGRMTNAELAEAIGLSESPTLRRVRALEHGGVITGYGARIDQRSLDLQVTAFVQVQLEKHDEGKTKAFMGRVEEEPHIVECHAMSGAYDYLLKVVALNMDHFSELTMDGILAFPGVRNIESSFSLKTLKQSTPLPVNGA